MVVTGCTGFVYSMVIAEQFIATGAYRTILIVGVELLSRFVDWTDRSMCVLFGDAAGAIVVQASDPPLRRTRFCAWLGRRHRPAHHHARRRLGSPFQRRRIGRRQPVPANERPRGLQVRYTPDRSCQRTGTAQRRADHEQRRFNHPHPANLRIIQAADREMKLPMERFIVNLDRYGNTSAASIPLALSESVNDGTICPQTGWFSSLLAPV